MKLKSEAFDVYLRQKYIRIIDLEKMTGVPSSTICKLKTDKKRCVKYETIKKLADALDVNVLDIAEAD